MFRRIACCVSVMMTLSGGAVACDGRLIDDNRIYGSPICIPETPQRVVVLDPSFSLGIGLDLGLPIVGAPLMMMSDESLRERAEAAGVANLGFVTEPSLERIIALQPDLIVGFTGNPGLAESVYPMLSAFVPTLLDVSGNWRGYYDTIGNLTGHQDEVAELFDAYQTRLEDVRARMPDLKVSIVRITPWDFQVYTKTPGAYAPFDIAHEAGVQRTAYETAPDGPSVKRPDWEELAGLDGDILLYIVGGTNDSETSGRHEEVTDNPLWQMLPAVQVGRVYKIDPATWMEFSGLTSAHRVLDDIEQFIINTQ